MLWSILCQLGTVAKVPRSPPNLPLLISYSHHLTVDDPLKSFDALRSQVNLPINAPQRHEPSPTISILLKYLLMDSNPDRGASVLGR